MYVVFKYAHFHYTTFTWQCPYYLYLLFIEWGALLTKIRFYNGDWCSAMYKQSTFRTYNYIFSTTSYKLILHMKYVVDCTMHSLKQTRGSAYSALGWKLSKCSVLSQTARLKGKLQEDKRRLSPWCVSLVERITLISFITQTSPLTGGCWISTQAWDSRWSWSCNGHGPVGQRNF